MRKVRSDAGLLNLPPEKKRQIAEWLASGLPELTVRTMVEKEYGLLASLSSFSRFWAAVAVPMLLLKRDRAVTTADAIAEEASKSPNRIDLATIDAIKQKAFEISITPGANPSDVKSLFMLVLKCRDQDLDSEQLKLSRDRFQFNAAEACLAKLPELKLIVANSGLDQRQKIDAIREKLFGELAS